MSTYPEEGKVDDVHFVENHPDVPSAVDLKNRDLVVDNEAQGYVDPTLHISEAESARLRRRIHRHILPLMCMAYLCQALDKGTLGTASIMGWINDVHAVGQDYSLTSTLLWCGIIVGEPVANQFVRRLPLGKLLAGGIFIWSALLMGLAFSLRIPAVFGIRFLLGFFESLIGPCLLSITVQWYLKQEQAFVSSVWQCMLGASSAISALLGYGFYHVQDKHGGLYGWQWMTIAISLFSFICSGIMFVFMPDSPTRARWASEEDKVKLVERVRSNNQGLKHKVFKSKQAIEAITDPLTYLLFGMAFFNTMIVGGINTFSSLLINKAFGFSVLNSQLLSIPLGTMTVVMYMLMAFLITKTRQTIWCMIAFCIPNIAGTIVLLTVPPTSSTKGGLVVAFYIMQCFQACQAGYFLMLSRNSAGQTKKSITYAVTYIGWSGGNAVAPQLFQARWAPRYLHSLVIHLVLYGCFIVTCLATRMLLQRRNRIKEANREATDLGAGAHADNLHAFEDLTDRENPDFIYSV